MKKYEKLDPYVLKEENEGFVFFKTKDGYQVINLKGWYQSYNFIASGIDGDFMFEEAIIL